MKVLWSVVALVTFAVPAYAGVDGDDDEKKPAVSDPLKRLEKVEEELRQLKAENAARNAGLPDRMTLEDQEKKDAPKPEAEFKVSFTEFHLRRPTAASTSTCRPVAGREYRYIRSTHRLGASFGRQPIPSMPGPSLRSTGRCSGLRVQAERRLQRIRRRPPFRLRRAPSSGGLVEWGSSRSSGSCSDRSRRQPASKSRIL